MLGDPRLPSSPSTPIILVLGQDGAYLQYSTQPINLTITHQNDFGIYNFSYCENWHVEPYPLCFTHFAVADCLIRNEQPPDPFNLKVVFGGGARP